MKLPIPLSGLVLVPALVLVVPTGGQAAPAPQNTFRVSVKDDGGQANGSSTAGDVSADGRYVTFYSLASNLVAGDTNSDFDVFVRDRMLGTTVRASVSTAGVEGNDRSWVSRISRDGRFVVFLSSASNLVPGDTNGTGDIFVRDLVNGTTERVNLDSAGNQTFSTLLTAQCISGDGSRVAFVSDSSTLVPFDTNGTVDAFVRDRNTGVTTRVSVSSAGVEGDMWTTWTSISADGNCVAFASGATNLVPGDTNGKHDAFVHEMDTGITTRISVGSAGEESDKDSLIHTRTISADGRYVAFTSNSKLLAPGDTDFKDDVYVHDRVQGTTTMVSVDSAGNHVANHCVDPSISDDGRRVCFESRSANLVSGDTNVETDVFVHDLDTGVTTRESIGVGGAQGNADSGDGMLSGDGRFTYWRSVANTFVPGDTNGDWDMFLRGPDLTLDASATTLSTGDPITLTTWGGGADGLVFLVATAINGTPGFFKVLQGRFDASGQWELSSNTPGGLGGSLITLQSFGIGPSGKVELTNSVDLTFASS